MIALLATAWGADCGGSGPESCRCEQERLGSVVRSLREAPLSAAHASNLEAWQIALDATCDWAGELPGDADAACLRTTTCVRRVTEARLALVNSPSAAARAVDLARATGRLGCTSSAGPSCAESAFRAEQTRLDAVVRALADRGLAPAEAQRWWLAYRDAVCEAEAIASDGDLSWARAACAAVATQRRADLLVAVATVGDEPLAEAIALRRIDEAAKRARVPGRPWEGWLATAPDPARARERLREGLEALEDGALAPALVATDAWTACTEGRMACLDKIARSVHREALLAAPPSADRWRSRWCPHDDGESKLSCEATVDWVFAGP